MDELLRHLALFGRPFPRELRQLYIDIDTAGKHPKRPRDPNQLADSIVENPTGEREDRAPTPEEQGKNAAAVSLGGRGPLNGGKAKPATRRG